MVVYFKKTEFGSEKFIPDCDPNHPVGLKSIVVRVDNKKTHPKKSPKKTQKTHLKKKLFLGFLDFFFNF
jgi:hypothetical protein